MLVVGDQEAENGAVNVRKYGEQKSETVSLDDFVKKAVAEAKNNWKYKNPVHSEWGFLRIKLSFFCFSIIANSS